MGSSSHTDGGVVLQVTHIGHTAYGRARYRVILRDEVEGDRIVFASEALELPWVDDRRALRDAAGFLWAYADPTSGAEPGPDAGVTLAELANLQPYAGKLEQIAADLDDDD